MSIIKKVNGTILKNFYTEVTTSASIGTGETKACVVNIPANTFLSGDIIHISSGAYNSSATQPWNMYYYWNTANTLTGAVQISGTENIAVGNQFCHFIRTFHIIDSTGGGNGTLGLNINARINRVDFQNVIGPLGINVRGTYAINWGLDSYIMVALSADATQPIDNRWLKVSTY